MISAPPIPPQHYRITDPVSGLCIRLNEITEPGHAPRIVPQLVPGAEATRFTTRNAARAAWSKHIGVAVLELERVDA